MKITNFKLIENKRGVILATVELHYWWRTTKTVQVVSTIEGLAWTYLDTGLYTPDKYVEILALRYALSKGETSINTCGVI